MFACAFALCAQSASAQNLVQNPGFEVDVFPSGGGTGGVISDWSGNPDGGIGFGVGHPDASLELQLPKYEGDNYSYMNVPVGQDRGLAQTIGAVALGETYDASAMFGWRNDNVQSVVAIQLWIGGVISDGDIIGGTLVASDSPVTVQGGWVQGTTSYVVAPADVGQLLHVRLMATANPPGAQSNFDNVSVTRTFIAPVPTMSEWALILLGLMLAGGAALLLQQRRNIA